MPDKKLSLEEQEQIGKRLNEIIEARGIKKNTIAPQIFNDGRHKNPDQYLSKLLGGGGGQTPTSDYEAILDFLGLTWETLYLKESEAVSPSFQIAKTKYESMLFSAVWPGHEKFVDDLKAIDSIKDINTKKAAKEALISEALEDLRGLLKCKK
jgi:hypothetical protein